MSKDVSLIETLTILSIGLSSWRRLIASSGSLVAMAEIDALLDVAKTRSIGLLREFRPRGSSAEASRVIWMWTTIY